jgi:hypothetical protein
VKKTGPITSNSKIGDLVMSKKASAKKESKKVEKINTEPDQKEILSSWLDNYCSQKNSAAKLCTLALRKGTTLSEMQTICKDFASKQSTPQKWGTSKNSDLTGHCRWLKSKGYSVTVSDSGKYHLEV